jgi:hypothetical protein
MSSHKMRRDVALKRYLDRHIEPGLPNAPAVSHRWQQVLVIPAYDEPPGFLSALSQLGVCGRALIIVVINRPDSNPDTQANSLLRCAIAKLPRSDEHTIEQGSDSVDLFCYDQDQLNGPIPSSQGVGLARKIGCDIALLWQRQGAISSKWICSTDADAQLPSDYFSRLERAEDSVAALFPFVHVPGKSEEIDRATALYEIRLHQYVLGLSYAQSPYAYHTLGSCIAVKSQHYCEVRGYPKRSGGEDFYLLNKLAKVGPIASLGGECIALQSRVSHRVPFGTGPAIKKIIEYDSGDESTLFYHPQCFEVLRVVLAIVEQLQVHEASELRQLLVAQGLDDEIALATTDILHSMEITKAISHCRKHGKSGEQFLRQFHQWFDGFKTLKFLHGVRDATLPMQSLSSTFNLQPMLFPTRINDIKDSDLLRAAIRQQWQWSVGCEI